MKKIAIQKNGVSILNAWHANHYFSRLRGLRGWMLGEGEGLLLTPCNCIHTFGMRYEIDAVYLDRNGLVLRVDEKLAIGRIWPAQRGAKHVLELRGGRAKKLAICTGDRLEVQ